MSASTASHEVSRLPSVSVVIPCYNQGHFLREALESVLRQSRLPEEIIVVDDGSTDGTPTVCHDYRREIVCLRQANSGLSAARNSGIRQASSEFIHFLDSDDLLRATAIAELLGAAARLPEGDVFRASWDEIDEDGTILTHVRDKDLGADAYHALFDPLVIGPPSRYMARREAVIAAGNFETDLRSCEDWDLWFRLAATGKRFVSVPEAVIAYRRHATAMSRNHERMWRSGADVLARAKARHGCEECATAYADGLSRWREYCYLSILREDIRLALLDRRIFLATTKAVRAVRRDPPVSRLVAASILRNLMSAWR